MYCDCNRPYRVRRAGTRSACAPGLSLLSTAAALALAGAVPVGAQQTPSAPALVFDGVTVVDVEAGKLLADQRVVITGNRIQAVGGSRAVPLPKNARVLDARGKYLIPGLWDMHTHSDTLASSFYPLFISQGITGIRDAYAFISVQTQVRWWHEILAGTRVGPPRQLLAGQNPARDYDDMVKRKALGVNFLKVYPFDPAQAPAARRVGLPFGGHVGGIHGETSAFEASDSGISIIDHVNSSGGLDTLCLPPNGTLERCQAVAEVFKRNGTWWVPTLMINAIDPRFGLEKELSAGMPFQIQLADIVRNYWENGWPLPNHDNWLRNPIGGSAAGTAHTGTADSGGIMRLAQRVGLPVLVGTDMGAPNVKQMLPGFSLHTELAILVAEGLSPLNALQGATLNPAKMFHATDSLGTVAAGKLADLVLLDADPLADITNTTMIRAVVANGRYYDRDALDALLADIRANPSLLVRSEADTLSH